MLCKDKYYDLDNLDWGRFNYEPEKTEEDKFKKDMSLRFDALKFNWRKINMFETKYNFTDSINFRHQVQATDLSTVQTVALFTITW